jgi:Ca2+-binding RTX toxin-like protein
MTPITTRAMLAGALVAGALGLTAAQADAAYAPAVKDRTLLLAGDAAGDRLALRMAATKLPTLEADVGDDGTADFRVALSRFDRVRVLAGDGADRVRVQDIPLPVTVDGGAGDDTLTGGKGADTLIGGDGDDFVDAQQGADTVLLGAGDDVLAWSAGDGDDVVEGGKGTDSLRMSGNSGGERFEASSAGLRVRVSRSNANGAETVDTGAIERLSEFSFGGADTLVVDNLAGTALTDIDASLFDFGVPGGNQDVVVVSGSAGNDSIKATSDASGVSVTGLQPRVHLTGTEPAGDRVEINGLSGDDTIDSTGLDATKMRLRADGGAGGDVLLGGAGDDVLSGGDGADVLFAGGGDNVVFGGAGDDILRGEAGDDFLDGGAGDDVLIGNAGDDILLNGEVVFDD